MRGRPFVPRQWGMGAVCAWGSRARGRGAEHARTGGSARRRAPLASLIGAVTSRGAEAARGPGAHAPLGRPRRCSSGAVPKRWSAERAMARDGKGRGQTPAAAAEPGLRERGP